MHQLFYLFSIILPVHLEINYPFKYFLFYYIMCFKHYYSQVSQLASNSINGLIVINFKDFNSMFDSIAMNSKDFN